MNRGNFLEILNLLYKINSNHDPVIKDQLKNGPKNAKYKSPDIQNSLMSVMVGRVRELIFICM